MGPFGGGRGKKIRLTTTESGANEDQIKTENYSRKRFSFSK